MISVPAIPKGRYYSLQFIDMYTHNFAYVGSRATGNDAGHYLLAGPAWQGAEPEGVKSVIRSETQCSCSTLGVRDGIRNYLITRCLNTAPRNPFTIRGFAGCGAIHRRCGVRNVYTDYGQGSGD